MAVVDNWEQYQCWFLQAAHWIAFVLAFGIGANDVANSFGTSVGSGVLTLRQACWLASVFEVSGAILLGHKVSDKMWRDIVDIFHYEGHEFELILGCVSALTASAIWMFVATFLGMPVSSTHSMVGAIVGFSLCGRGLDGLKWSELTTVFMSWVFAPLLSGVLSLALFYLMRMAVLYRRAAFKAALVALPVVFGLTIFVNILSVVLNGSSLLRLQRVPVWIVVCSSLAVSLLSALVLQFLFVPYIRYRIVEGISPGRNSVVDFVNFYRDRRRVEINGIDLDDPQLVTRSLEIKRVNYLFRFLQVLTAVFVSFVHGGNDVSNAVAPLTAIYFLYTKGSIHVTEETPFHILLFGGVGISIGLMFWGRRVMDTIGKRITPLTPVVGFIIEFGAASTVLVFSKLGLPISTTHCLTGSLIVVGWANARSHYETEASIDNMQAHVNKRSINWRLFCNITIAWAVSLPVSASLSALVMLILTNLFRSI